MPRGWSPAGDTRRPSAPSTATNTRWITTSPSHSTSFYTPERSSSMARKVFGALRLAAGITIFVTLAFQIQDEVAHNAMIPGHYFAYFTIQSSMINVVVLLAGGAYAIS